MGWEYGENTRNLSPSILSFNPALRGNLVGARGFEPAISCRQLPLGTRSIYYATIHHAIRSQRYHMVIASASYGPPQQDTSIPVACGYSLGIGHRLLDENTYRVFRSCGAGPALRMIRPFSLHHS